MKTLMITKSVLDKAKRGSMRGSKTAQFWPIGSTLRLITNAGDEVHAEIERIDPSGTAYDVLLANVKIIRQGKDEPEYISRRRPGVR